MNNRENIQKQAKLLRNFRKAHRLTGLLLFVFFFFVSGTGLLLGWKKHSAGFILPETRSGSSSAFEQWLPLDSLHSIAVKTYKNHRNSEMTEIDRIDIRKDKGVAKFTFKDSREEIQLDGATGEVLQTGIRRSDTLESIHDGSILDEFFNTDGIIKVTYTSIMSLGLFLFTVTGFWLWYGPKKLRKSKQ